MTGSEGGDQVPDLRASDGDRERAALRLRSAAARGQLDVEELEERLTAAFASRTTRELAALTADLGESDEDELAAQPAGPAVRFGEGGDRWVVSVMSGNDRTGHWRLAPRVRVINVMGGSDLDLTEAEFSSPVTEMTVVSVMGGSEIYVPEGLRVEASRFALMGGNDVKLGPHRQPDHAPVLRVRLISIMGGSELVRGRKKSRKEKRLEREQRKALEDSDP
jgi:hypothetical protein